MNLIISSGRKGALCSCVLSLLPAKLQLFILLGVLLQSNCRCQSLLGFKNDFNFLRGLEKVSGLICCLWTEALVLWPLSMRDKLRVTVLSLQRLCEYGKPTCPDQSPLGNAAFPVGTMRRLVGKMGWVGLCWWNCFCLYQVQDPVVASTWERNIFVFRAHKEYCAFCRQRDGCEILKNSRFSLFLNCKVGAKIK